MSKTGEPSLVGSTRPEALRLLAQKARAKASEPGIQRLARSMLLKSAERYDAAAEKAEADEVQMSGPG